MQRRAHTRLFCSALLAATAVATLALPARAADAPPANPNRSSADLGPQPVDLTPGSGWTAGGAAFSINPTPAMLAGSDFYLGGFGLGSGKVASGAAPTPTLIAGRNAAGILGEGAKTRAMAIGDGRHAMVTAQIETQGYFLAYKDADVGLVDIRRQAAIDIAAIRRSDPGAGPDLPASAILVDSDHTHSGADTAGVFGGVPASYLQLVKNQSVKAIVEAWRAMRPVDLYYGTAVVGVNGAAYDSRYPAGFDKLMNNQFSDDPNNLTVDDELRVIQGRDPVTHVPVVTYSNFSAHPDVLGASNLLLTGDYIDPLSNLLASQGGFGFDQVATLGREQPERGGCASPINTGPDAGVPQTACLDNYAQRVYARAQTALASAVPVTGPKLVSLTSNFITDAASNAVILGLDDGGYAVGANILRSNTPPWETGNIEGSVMYSGRIGNLVLDGMPGEAYPQILQVVRDDAPGKQGYLSLGTAGDFLGYIVYPFSAYPEPIRRSILSGDPPPAGDPNCQGSGVGSPVGCPAPIGNDNYFFNVSMTFGQRLVCAELRGLNAHFPEDGVDYTAKEAACAAFASDGLFGGGYETQWSSTSLVPADPAADAFDPAASLPETPYAVLFLVVGLGVAGLGALSLRHRRRVAR